MRDRLARRGGRHRATAPDDRLLDCSRNRDPHGWREQPGRLQPQRAGLRRRRRRLRQARDPRDRIRGSHRRDRGRDLRRRPERDVPEHRGPRGRRPGGRRRLRRPRHPRRRRGPRDRRSRERRDQRRRGCRRRRGVRRRRGYEQYGQPSRHLRRWRVQPARDRRCPGYGRAAQHRERDHRGGGRVHPGGRRWRGGPLQRAPGRSAHRKRLCHRHGGPAGLRGRRARRRGDPRVRQRVVLPGRQHRRSADAGSEQRDRARLLARSRRGERVEQAADRRGDRAGRRPGRGRARGDDQPYGRQRIPRLRLREGPQRRGDHPRRRPARHRRRRDRPGRRGRRLDGRARGERDHTDRGHVQAFTLACTDGRNPRVGGADDHRAHLDRPELPHLRRRRRAVPGVLRRFRLG